MKKLLLHLLLSLPLLLHAQSFVPENEMQRDLLNMLARFSTYMVNDFQPCQEPNSQGEACGCFRGESTMRSNEAGVRTNADLSMVCAFLVRYAQPEGIMLPQGITYAQLDSIARQSLCFAYSTHKANRLKVCAGGDYWGSTSNRDRVWESSLWAMSVAYSAWFQWDKLSAEQRGYIYQLLKAECNYQLQRTVPTGFRGDTKAEENGWEADVLAVTLGLFPDDTLAPKWFERMRLFAINSYSHPTDATDATVIDPNYNSTTVSDLYRGQNLYADFSLQNHNLFHTSYQNVVQQELGEAALALRLFQSESEHPWHTNALMHHNREVMDSVLYWLALADGELAMPNGNDWSLFLYDQITSYSTLACFMRDPDALMLENLAYQQIRKRQLTTPDGSWLLRPDVQARRMGVEAHRVMMTYLMHHTLSTANLSPTRWEDFRRRYSQARLLPCQDIVRAFTASRFSCFSWSEGLHSYTGYFTPNTAQPSNVIVPFRANNTGNLIGWYEVKGHKNNAAPALTGQYHLEGDGWWMNGILNTNDDRLQNRFSLFSTPGNALIYLDEVTALDSCTIITEKGGLLAISLDEMTALSRTLYYAPKGEAHNTILSSPTDGTQLQTYATDWINIDNQIGIVGFNGKQMAFGDRQNNNSIFTAKLYPMYSNAERTVAPGEVVDARHLVYYSQQEASATQQMALKLTSLKPELPAGWNGVIVADGEDFYLFVSHFSGAVNEVSLKGLKPIRLAPNQSFGTKIKNKDSITSKTKYKK